LAQVATESPDGRTTYLHRFVPAKDRSILLPPPQDGRTVTKARLWHNHRKVTLEQTPNGVRLTLGIKDSWDDVDTIFVLE
jgi:hypothetical protein